MDTSLERKLVSSKFKLKDELFDYIEIGVIDNGKQYCSYKRVFKGEKEWQTTYWFSLEVECMNRYKKMLEDYNGK